MPNYFWSEAAGWACHVLNRCTSISLDEKVPKELWIGSKPSVEHFKVFGCIGHVHITSQQQTKLYLRSHKCVFLGVSQESKAYRLYDPSSKKVVISRDVIFDEDAVWNWSKQNQETQELIIEDDERVQENPQEDDEQLQENSQEEENIEGPQISPNPNPNYEEGAGSPAQGTSQPQNSHENSNSPISPASKNSQNQNTPPGHPRRAPTWIKDYYMTEDIFNEDEASFAMYSVMDDPLT